MTLSEFWDAVDDVFGRSLTADLYLPSLRGTCVDALDRGVSPDMVWSELLRESDADEAVRWVHRLDAKEREKIRRSKHS